MAVIHAPAAGWLALVLVAGALPSPALAAWPTRIHLFDVRGNRTGAAVEGGQVDLFDLRSNRTGSGRFQDGRRVDFFDPRANRTGYAVIEGDRVDLFDVRGSRTGSGRIRDGEVQTFERQGNRTGVGQRPTGWGRYARSSLRSR